MNVATSAPIPPSNQSNRKHKPATIRPVEVGDPVVYDRTFAGTVARVHRPGVFDSTVDLTYIDSGVLRVAQQVPHGAGLGCWRTQAEIDAEKALTPRDIYEQARSRGERVPLIGMWIRYGFDMRENGYLETRPTRARVIGIHSLTTIDLECYSQFPPSDPLADDLPIRAGTRRNIVQAEAATERVAKEGYPNTWIYPDSDPDLIQPFRELSWKVFPPFVCGRCSAPSQTGTPIYIGPVLTDPNAKGYPTKPVISWCQKCADLLASQIRSGAVPIAGDATATEPAPDLDPAAEAALVEAKLRQTVAALANA
jgi:hypothetical protein